MRIPAAPCYGSRLKLSPPVHSLDLLSTRNYRVCREQFSVSPIVLLFTLFLLAFSGVANGQNAIKKPNLSEDIIRLYSLDKEESKGAWRYLRHNARIETSSIVISADEIDYNSDTDWTYARGHVHLDHYETGEKIDCDRAEYNLNTQNGHFENVSGTAPAKIVASPSVLTTTNPFYFHAQWADRIKTRYILHHGYLTDCTVSKPWWRFHSPLFDIVPGDRAIARNTTFRLKGVPIFYLPYFYRPLGKKTRQSGFLTPNFGNSTRYGYIYGGGFYWAINRSYDMTAVGQYYTKRGPALRYDFRGKPNEATDFDFNYYGVKDSGYIPPAGPVQKQGGLEFELNVKTEILGFTGRLNYNYLSSFLFRQAFAYSIASAVPNEVYSIGFLQRHFQHDAYSLNIVFQRDQLFNAATPVDDPPNQQVLQKLPAVELFTRDQNPTKGRIPLWWSLEASTGAYSRSEPRSQGAAASLSRALDSGVYMRSELTPRVMTSFQFKGFAIAPSMSLNATSYGNSYSRNTTAYAPVSNCGNYLQCPPNAASDVAFANASVFRKNVNFGVDFRLPSIEKIYRPPQWMHLGNKIKHVAELDARYQYVTGIENFSKLIRFNARDTFSDTNQLTISLTNHFYRKEKNGKVAEVIKWRVTQARFFDPTFGGAAVPGQRSVVFATEEFSPFAFLDGARNYSPVASTLTVTPYNFFALDWRTEYDPVRQKFIDHSLSGTVRYSKFFVSVGDVAVTTSPLLVPQANQVTIGGGYGNSNRKGWNAAGTIYYDVLLNRRLFNFIQGSYNTDCCGFSVQLRQFNLGIRNDNQYLFSFSVANIGNFGSLNKQSRIF